MEVYMSQSAHDAISAQALKGQEADLEYGGSLLAWEFPERLVVAYALPTGPAADQGYSHIQTDAAYQNLAIAAILQQLPELSYVGDWHIHPMWLPRLSGVDLRTAQEMLRDPDLARDRLYLALGSVTPEGEPWVGHFLAQSGLFGQLRVKELQPHLLPDDAPLFLQLAGQALPPIEELLRDMHHRPHPTHDLERIQRDLEQLGAPYQLTSGGGYLSASLDHRGHRLSLLFPPEYPINAPDVLLGHWGDESPPRPHPTTHHWNSLHDLADLLADLPEAPPRKNQIQRLLEASPNHHLLDDAVVVVTPELLTCPEGTLLYGTREVEDGVERRLLLSDVPAPGLLPLAVVAEDFCERDDSLRLRIQGGQVACRRGLTQWRALVLDEARYRDRVEALPGAQAAQGRRVLLVGLGSVGSEMGARLARLGVRVVGCDPDLLEMQNLIRWGLTLAPRECVGRAKATVWAQHLNQHIPGAQVVGHKMDVVKRWKAFEELLRQEEPDLVVVCTDTRDSRRVVNATCARLGLPALYVALAEGASSVRLEVVRDAAQGPCHLCSSLGESADGAFTRSESGSRVPYSAQEQPQAAEPALPVDVSLGTGMATRVALSMLSGQGWEPWFTHGQQRGNVMFLSLRADWWVFEEPWQRLVYQASHHHACLLEHPPPQEVTACSTS